MIADKVNQAQNVIIAEIKKKPGERGEGIEKVVYASKIAYVIANCAILLNKLQRFNDVWAHKPPLLQFQFNLTCLLIIEINLK